MSFLPRREAELLGWSVNFDTLLAIDPTIYGLTLAQASEYNTLHTAFASAYQTAIDPPSRTASTISAKNIAKAALIAKARELVKIIQSYPGTTNPMREDLNITVPDPEPTPVPVPANPPAVEVVLRFGKSVTIRMHDSVNPTNRGKPPFVDGASVFSYVGEDPPADIADWQFEINTGKTVNVIEFPPSTPGGSKVWFTAFWFNTRKESGPAASPVSTRLGDGVSQAA